MNKPFHEASYALNKKWYVNERIKKRPPSNDKEVMKGFQEINKEDLWSRFRGSIPHVNSTCPIFT